MRRTRVVLAEVCLAFCVAAAAVGVGVGPAAAVCETSCAPTPGAYTVNGGITASLLRWTGSARLAGPTTGRIAISFAAIPAGILHPPDPCDLGLVGLGTINATWDNGATSAITAIAIHPPSPTVPAQPVFGIGVVTSGALARDIVTFNWQPPVPICPGTATPITGNLTFAAP